MCVLYEPDYREVLLQHSWNRLPANTNLVTTDNKEVVVISNGTWNIEDGPDFRNAVIEIDRTVVRGDVEIHNNVSDWKAHGHSSDRNYDGVILHVVANASLSGDCSPRIPTVILPERLLAFSARGRRKFERGACSRAFREFQPEKLESFFGQIGLLRFNKKSMIILSEIQSRGAERAMLHFLFDALGFKSNREAFHALFERLMKYDIARYSDDEVNAIVWGESGLLPDYSTGDYDDDCMAMLGMIWSIWWRNRICDAEDSSSGTDDLIRWNFSGIRPFNSPHRRIAAASALLNRFKKMPDVFLEWFSYVKSASSGTDFTKMILPSIICGDAYWDRRCRFGKAMRRQAAILGGNRAIGIVINVILPFLHSYSKILKNGLEEKIVKIWADMPSDGQFNIFQKIFISRCGLTKAAAGDVLKKAAAQQGCIYLYRNICENSSKTCGSCPVINMINEE